jgi:hypothetical protein
MQSSRTSETHCLAEKWFSPDRFSPGLWQKALRKYSRGALKSEPGFYEISGIMRNMKKQRFSLGLWQKALRKYPGRALRKKFHILPHKCILMLKSPTASWLHSYA